MKQFAVLIFGICITVISIAQPSFTEHLVDGDFEGARDVTTVDLENEVSHFKIKTLEVDISEINTVSDTNSKYINLLNDRDNH